MVTLSRIIGLNPLRGTPLNFIRTICLQQKSVSKPPLVTQTDTKHRFWLHKNKSLALHLPRNNACHVNLPSGMIWSPFVDRLNEVTEPDVDNTIHAARLIIIRRKKMRKHKLKKLRKRMKFEIAKRRLKRELLKEKEFLGGLIQQCKAAESFSAEEYVNERLRKYTESTNASQL